MQELWRTHRMLSHLFLSILLNLSCKNELDPYSPCLSIHIWKIWLIYPLRLPGMCIALKNKCKKVGNCSLINSMKNLHYKAVQLQTYIYLAEFGLSTNLRYDDSDLFHRFSCPGLLVLSL